MLHHYSARKYYEIKLIFWEKNQVFKTNDMNTDIQYKFSFLSDSFRK